MLVPSVEGKRNKNQSKNTFLGLFLRSIMRGQKSIKVAAETSYLLFCTFKAIIFDMTNSV